MVYPSAETLKRAMYRALSAMVLGAGAAFVAVPVNVEEPKKYMVVLLVAMVAGALQGLQKLVSGFVKYDR